jgi:hypothetical protein
MLHPEASTAQLLAILEQSGEACVRVVALPLAERRRTGKEGTTSPEQAATLHAWLFVKAAAQLIERGVLPVDWLEEVLA